METVGHHLQMEAINRTSESEKDLFGRSSYNRYYYATFLCVRNLLTKLDPKWGQLTHSSYPEVLNGSVRSVLRGGIRDATRGKDWDLVRLCQRARTSSSELADLMKIGFTTRVTADYQPDVRVIFSGANRFVLNTVSINDAHNWPAKARSLTETIDAAWRQINV